ncbi:MAG: hypothetical protein OXU63_17765 [Acidobacteriota bacterium]|nr:hypothetical protein [Acidobacteriota bacterium]
MSKRTIQALASTLAVIGAVLLLSGQVSAQTEVETISSSEYGTIVRFRDDDGVLVKRFSASGLGVGASPFTRDSFFDEHGNVEREVTRYPDGRSVTEHRAFGRPLSEGSESLPLARGRNMSREEMDGFLSRLPPLPGTSGKTEWGLHQGRPRPVDGAASDSVHPWGHHWKESADGIARTSFRLLHQEMQVESVRQGGNRLRISDNRGGDRHDYLTETAWLDQSCHCVAFPAVASYDALGRIVHMVTNDDGYPTEARYGETLVARYHYAHVDGVRPLPAHGDLGDFWVELTDARTGNRLLDSRALPTTAAQPLFSAGGPNIRRGVIESVGDELFAVVYHSVSSGERYALLPLDEGPVWRTVQAAGTEAPELRSLVHYTNDRLRIEFRFDNTDLVVEAPRRGFSAVKVTWPQDITLPLLATAKPAN